MAETEKYDQLKEIVHHIDYTHLKELIKQKDEDLDKALKLKADNYDLQFKAVNERINGVNLLFRTIVFLLVGTMVTIIISIIVYFKKGV